jgi:hypothetical protein
MANHRLYSKDPTIALALLELAEEEENFSISAPLYPMPHYLDGSHPTAASYRRLGGYEGIGWKRWLFDGVKPRYLKPLAPIWTDGAVIIPFDVPVGRLVFDTTLVSNPGSYGFTLVDSGGTARTIDSVTLLGTDRVVLRYSGAALTSGAKVWYARGADLTRSGPVIGPRGNLRDQQGDALTFHGDPMHNWSPIFCKTRG